MYIGLYSVIEEYISGYLAAETEGAVPEGTQGIDTMAAVPGPSSPTAEECVTLSLSDCLRAQITCCL